MEVVNTQQLTKIAKSGFVSPESIWRGISGCVYFCPSVLIRLLPLDGVCIGSAGVYCEAFGAVVSEFGVGGVLKFEEVRRRLLLENDPFDTAAVANKVDPSQACGIIKLGFYKQFFIGRSRKSRAHGVVVDVQVAYRSVGEERSPFGDQPQDFRNIGGFGEQAVLVGRLYRHAFR